MITCDRPAMKITIFIFVVIFTCSAFLIRDSRSAEESLTKERTTYQLIADETQIEVAEDGSRRLTAHGNARLTYAIDNRTWQLSADSIDYIESHKDKSIISQTARAFGDIAVSGPDLIVNASGEISVDFIARQLTCSDPDTHITFPTGEMLTDHMVVSVLESNNEEPDLLISTGKRTEGNYILSHDQSVSEPQRDDKQASIFGSLVFDFAQINIKTKDTSLRIVNGEPYRLDCPGSTVISSSINKMTLPACAITFNPPVLTGSSGVKIEIGDIASIEAVNFSFTYPPDGGMELKLDSLCNENDPALLTNTELPTSVIIRYSMGTFYASGLIVKVDPDGKRYIKASGRTKLEMRLGEIIELGE